ncbi:three-helix bundle dimerization domain-containing protein [Streptomyces phaeofaciens]
MAAHGARIRDFVPIFVERQACAALEASGEHSEPPEARLAVRVGFRRGR